MARGYEAVRSVNIKASPDDVWKALTDPEKVKRYMHGTEIATDWKKGSPIYWRGEWKGRRYEDKGTILAIEAGKLLSYSHWSPMGGSEDKPENYHTVTYELEGGGDGETRLVLKQDNNPTQEEADQMAEKNWGPVLEGLKTTAEGTT